MPHRDNDAERRRLHEEQKAAELTRHLAEKNYEKVKERKQIFAEELEFLNNRRIINHLGDEFQITLISRRKRNA